MKRIAAVVMTVAMSFVAVARGMELCLCDDDPDECGHACHECGHAAPDGLRGGEDCLHLDLPAVDLALADDGVPLPSVGEVPHPVPASSPLPALLRKTPPGETSPPPWLSAYRIYSIRLFPRS